MFLLENFIPNMMVEVIFSKNSILLMKNRLKKKVSRWKQQ